MYINIYIVHVLLLRYPSFFLQEFGKFLEYKMKYNTVIYDTEKPYNSRVDHTLNFLAF